MEEESIDADLIAAYDAINDNNIALYEQHKRNEAFGLFSAPTEKEKDEHKVNKTKSVEVTSDN